MGYFKDVYEARYILTNLVRQDLKNKYRNSILGVGWSLLTPLGLVGIIGLVYSQVLGQPIKEFVPFLFSGLIPWLFLVQSSEGGAGSFINAEGYIKQTQVTINIFPIRVALVAFVQLLYSILAFVIMAMLIDINLININSLLVIPALCIWLLFSASIATLTGLINTFIRDFQPLQSLILQALFYATPILYPADFLEGSKVEWIYKYNPVYYLVELLRRPLLGEKIPDPTIWIVPLVVVFLLIIISLLTIRKIGRKITFRL